MMENQSLQGKARVGEEVNETRLVGRIGEELNDQDQFSQVCEPRGIFSQHEVGESGDVDRSFKMNAVAEEVFGPFRIERAAGLHECGDCRASGNDHGTAHDVEGKSPPFIELK